MYFKSLSLLACATLLTFHVTLKAQIDCAVTSTGFIPINDLGTDFFMGYQGGLYPGGLNTMPPAHRSAGNSIAKKVKPLNEAGLVDYENGKVVFVAFGASTAGNTFNSFKATVQDTSGLYNPCIKYINLCVGGKGLESMVPPGNKYYWTYMSDSVLADAGVTNAQVQIGWMKSASKDDSIPEFPLQPDSIYSKYIRSIQRIKDTFPNMKVLYLASHAYGGYAGELSDNADLAGEPAAYYGGFAVKWVIEAQINGDTRLRYKAPGIEAPWLAWAPYYWADGLIPRETDGLTWPCSDYDPVGGGFHLSEEGKAKEANMLIDFLYNDPLAKKWFRAGAAWTACALFDRNANGAVISHGPGNTNLNPDDVLIYPSPNTGNFYVSFYNANEQTCTVSIVNAQGQRIYTSTNTYAPGDVSLHIQLGDIPSGIYYTVIDRQDVQLEKAFIVND